ncbi:MAG TPA: tyrosinase family protein [Nitrososphaeraceae archaeon]
MSRQLRERKNISKVTDDERQALLRAFIVLNTNPTFRFPGSKDDTPFVGGVSFWFKQDEIHQATHVHGGPAFLTWHRELLNRFERLLVKADPTVSLHYWDWNEDLENTLDLEGKPLDLFKNLMGNARGSVGEPWLSAGFYDPYPAENYRGLEAFDEEHGNPADVPIALTRQKKYGTLEEYMKKEFRPFYSEKDIIESETFSEMRRKLEQVHNGAHNYIGGTIGDPHTAFRDPFVFLIHSNVDRLFAAWQLRKGFEWRLEPEKVYGDAKINGDSEKDTVAHGSTPPRVVVGLKTMLSPWCGIGYPYENYASTEEGKTEEPGVNDVRPWAFPENWHRDPKLYPFEQPKNSVDLSVVIPRQYDKFPVISGIEYNYDLARRSE